MYYLRNRSQIFKGLLTSFLGVFFVVATLIDEVSSPLLIPLLICVGLLLCAWVFFFQPSVRFDSHGIQLHNWLRSIHVPWSAYRGYKSRYGLVIVSAVAEYPVACYPGSGGLSKGREHINQARGKEIIPWLKPSQNLQWAQMKQARWALDAAAKEAGAYAEPVPERVKNLETSFSGDHPIVTWNSASLAAAATALFCFLLALFLMF